MDNKNMMFINMLPIKTDRLVIKQSSISDVEMLLKMDKQEETQEYLGGIKNKTREERIEFLKKKEDKFKDGIVSSLTVFKKDGTSIGFIGLKIDEENNDAEISYIFDRDYCNNGFCTEACKELLDICFNKLELQSVFADTIEGNNSSKRVLEKLGFKYQNSSIKDSKEFLNYIIKNKG